MAKGAGQGESGAGLAQRVIALDGKVEGGLQAVLEAAGEGVHAVEPAGGPVGGEVHLFL